MKRRDWRAMKMDIACVEQGRGSDSVLFLNIVLYADIEMVRVMISGWKIAQNRNLHRGGARAMCEALLTPQSK